MYLPKGSKWYSYKDNKKPLAAAINGGVEIDFYAPWNNPGVDNCAIFVREGAIIPTRELEQYIGELHSQGKENPVTINIYPGRNSSYRLYLDDDGISSRSESKHEYRLVQITHEGSGFLYFILRQKQTLVSWLDCGFGNQLNKKTGIAFTLPNQY